MTRTVLLDSAVLIYALGGPHEHRDPCRAVLAAVREGELAAATTTLALQEVLHQRARRTGDRTAAARVVADLAIVLPTLPLESGHLQVAVELFGRHGELDAADACHAAVALAAGATAIVTTDAAFDEVDGLQRFAPSALAAALSTGGSDR